MDIEVYSNPLPRIVVYNNTKEIMEDTRLKFVLVENHFLIKFSHTQLSDSGIYLVMVFCCIS
jgi:hypothetical protein